MVCTVPKRAAMLAECVASVEAQTFRDWELLVLCDDLYEGQSRTINRIAAEARGEWVVPFDDDDLMLPGFLAGLHAATDGDDVVRPAEIVFAPPDVEGEDPGQFRREPPMIPTPALIRTDLWRRLGGYDESVREQEDRMLWHGALSAGAVFKRVDEPLWIYRFHGGNKSRHGGMIP